MVRVSEMNPDAGFKMFSLRGHWLIWLFCLAAFVRMVAFYNQNRQHPKFGFARSD